LDVKMTDFVYLIIDSIEVDLEGWTTAIGSIRTTEMLPSHLATPSSSFLSIIAKLDGH
jgi:hypothetical protein